MHGQQNVKFFELLEFTNRFLLLHLGVCLYSYYCIRYARSHKYQTFSAFVVSIGQSVQSIKDMTPSDINVFGYILCLSCPAVSEILSTLHATTHPSQPPFSFPQAKPRMLIKFIFFLNSTIKQRVLCKCIHIQK